MWCTRVRELIEPLAFDGGRPIVDHFDTNDYSLDPRSPGRRVELTIGQREIIAIALDSGELCARHERSFAKHLCITDPAHQAELDRLRENRRRGPEVDVELRPLPRYDALIPA